VAELEMERKGVHRIFLRTQRPPYRRRFRIRVAGGKQQLRLMRPKRLRRFRARWPPPEAAFRQAFGRKPEPLTVIGQDLDRRPAAAAKDKHAAGKRVGIQLLAAQLRETINTFSCINGFDPTRMRSCGVI
jgi:hypothetical protein